MNENILKYQSRNALIHRIERALLKIMIFIVIPACMISYIIFRDPKLLNTIVILFFITGLVQLEICGLFKYVNYFGEELERVYNESGRTPSNITRAIYEFYNPEPTWRAYITNTLYFNKQFGFFLLIFSGFLQLYVTWCT